MDDPAIHGTIEQRVAEVHDLWQREDARDASEADRRRLQDLRVSLDQCWDLLRQRRALRHAALDPNPAALRRAELVERAVPGLRASGARLSARANLSSDRTAGVKHGSDGTRTRDLRRDRPAF